MTPAAAPFLVAALALGFRLAVGAYLTGRTAYQWMRALAYRPAHTAVPGHATLRAGGDSWDRMPPRARRWWR